MDELRARLRQIHHKPYKAYKTLQGEYRFADYRLSFDHVQGDPFAAPSRCSVYIAAERAGFPRGLWQTPARRIACEDFIARAFANGIERHVKGERGSGKSGEIAISTSGQQILQRNAVLMHDHELELRFSLGLPADLRSINSDEAEAMLFTELPAVVRQALFYENTDEAAMARHVDVFEDQTWLRGWLDEAGLVAFVADGAILPRRSGIDDRPLAAEVIPFQAPESLAHYPELPHGGKIRGMGVPAGVTLIVGGGFHGKSTLLHAIEYGVYNHIPGDGRERVVSKDSSMKVRAEDGRAISNVDISPFIDRLPFARDTRCFTTQNASGSTSQAANIIEALETGAQVLLIDEDTSATNFMIRDGRMQKLVRRDKEPITPLLYRVRMLYERDGISTIIVMGGSGDYFAVADTVIMLDAYHVKEVTTQAKALAGVLSEEDKITPMPIVSETQRRPDKAVLDGSRGRYAVKVDTRRATELFYGEHHIDLSKLEQLADIGQTKSIGWMMHYYFEHLLDGGASLHANLVELFQIMDAQGLDVFTPYKMGELARPRIQELAGAINRIREGLWL